MTASTSSSIYSFIREYALKTDIFSESELKKRIEEFDSFLELFYRDSVKKVKEVIDRSFTDFVKASAFALDLLYSAVSLQRTEFEWAVEKVKGEKIAWIKKYSADIFGHRSIDPEKVTELMEELAERYGKEFLRAFGHNYEFVSRSYNPAIIVKNGKLLKYEGEKRKVFENIVYALVASIFEIASEGIEKYKDEKLIEYASEVFNIERELPRLINSIFFKMEDFAYGAPPENGGRA